VNKSDEMNEADIESMLLDAAVDDAIGLWEVTWWVESQYPDESPVARREMAERCLRSLVSRGFVKLFRGTRFTGDEMVVPQDQIDAELIDGRWDPSEADGEHTRFAATDAGNSYYQDLAKIRYPTDGGAGASTL
jgi:hypothetical protein